jgi:hypothetical protein
MVVVGIYGAGDVVVVSADAVVGFDADEDGQDVGACLGIVRIYISNDSTC